MKKLFPSLTSCGVVCLALCILAPWPSRAEDTRLMSLGLRMGISGSSPIGEEEQSDFQQYDVVATFALPWGSYSQSGWGVGTRFLGSAGALTGAGETGFIATFVPGISLGSKDRRISLDIGIGFALLSKYQFGNQNFGGPFQLVANIGVSVAVYKALGLGYQFQHISDAGIYGSDSRGVDLHMFEVSYRY